MYELINITIRNVMGGVLYDKTILIDKDNITKTLIDELENNDIILEKGDTITIE